MIEYKVSLGHDVDISPYLENFIRFPDKSSNYLHETVDLLAITGREKEVETLIRGVADLIEPPYVIREAFMTDQFLNICHFPAIREKSDSPEAAENVVATMMGIGIPDLEVCVKRVEQNLKDFIAYDVPLDFSSFTREHETSNILAQLQWRFMGFLVNEIGVEMITACKFASNVTNYVHHLDFEEKLKAPFKYDSEALQRHITRRYTFLMYLKSIPAMGFLQAIIYFHQYLDGMEGAPKNDVSKIKSEGQEIFDLLRKSGSEVKSCVKRIFRTFPEFKGKVSKETH